jgi:hypothetical protein
MLVLKIIACLVFAFFVASSLCLFLLWVNYVFEVSKQRTLRPEISLQWKKVAWTSLKVWVFAIAIGFIMAVSGAAYQSANPSSTRSALDN